MQNEAIEINLSISIAAVVYALCDTRIEFSKNDII